MDLKERSYGFAISSRKQVLENPKFQEIFAPYADAIGINNEPQVAEWAGYLERQAVRDEKKKIEDEKKAKAEEERKVIEAIENAKKE